MQKAVEKEMSKYKPQIVKARIHTGGRNYEEIKKELKGQGFTCYQMKSMVKEGEYFDGLVLYLSKWNYDNHEKWHMYSWEDADDERVMLGMYQAEQYHPYQRYKKDFEQFQKDWKADEYDPGMTYTFKDSEVEVLEVLQEEVDEVDHEAVKKAVRQAEEAKQQAHRVKRQRARQRASKGSKYTKKFY